MVAILHTDSRAITGQPSGWATAYVDLDSGNTRLFITSKVAGGSEPADYSWTLLAADEFAYSMFRVSGAEDPATTAPVSATATQTWATSIDAPSVTPTYADSLVFRAAVIDADTITGTPGGETQEYIEDQGDVCGAASSFTHGASATGTGTFTSDAGDAWVAATIAFAPGGGGGGGSILPIVQQVSANA